MKIKICEKNQNQIKELLEKVQKNCSARLIDISDIYYTIKETERKIKNIPKKLHAGTKIVDGYRTTPSGYKYNFYNTIVTLVRGSSNWFLVDIDRKAGPALNNKICLSKEAKTYLIEKIDNDTFIDV